MKKRLSLLIFWVLAVFTMAGCGTLHLTVNEDGSGVYHYTFYENEYYTTAQMKAKIEEAVADTNESEGVELVKVKKFKEQNGKLEAILEVKRMFYKNDKDLFAPVQDILLYNPSILANLKAVNGYKENADFFEEDKLKKYTVVHFGSLNPSFDTKVTVPGKIAYISGGTLVEDEENTVKINSSNATIVYEPGGNTFSMVFGITLLIILIAGAGTYLFIKKTKKRNAPISNETGEKVENKLLFLLAVLLVVTLAGCNNQDKKYEELMAEAEKAMNDFDTETALEYYNKILEMDANDLSYGDTRVRFIESLIKRTEAISGHVDDIKAEAELIKKDFQELKYDFEKIDSLREYNSQIEHLLLKLEEFPNTNLYEEIKSLQKDFADKINSDFVKALKKEVQKDIESANMEEAETKIEILEMIQRDFSIEIPELGEYREKMAQESGE